jgi:hypothetical protein
LGKKRTGLGTRILKLALPAAKFMLRSKLLLILLALAAFGFWAGKHARPDISAVPFEEMFENLSVLSYRETPSDTAARFVVQLAARGKVFGQYDIDARKFLPPVRGHDYGRSISGTQYRALTIRGHVERGFWLELPDSSDQALLPDQFDELYRTTLDFVKPVNAVSTILGTLSGYSVGYRVATWSTSLANPAVQRRVLAYPGIGRILAREAWRRVLLEPVVMARESDADRFASVRGMQRIYTNFFRLALSDSDRFIPQEAARLDSLGRDRDARTMLAFAESARRAGQDTCDLTSGDFRAIEDWASLLDRRGHWAAGATPAAGEDRMRYLGTLAWYGLAPAPANEHRIWMGPRLLVREGDMEGFVADDIPLTGVGCPIAWREWLRRGDGTLTANTWAAQWVRQSRELTDAVDFGRDVARKLQGQP